MTNEDRQNFIQTQLPEFNQAVVISQQEISVAIGQLVIDKLTLEKQITIILDKLIETHSVNDVLRETIKTRQENAQPPKKT
jgi:hypothetical protein